MIGFATFVRWNFRDRSQKENKASYSFSENTFCPTMDAKSSVLFQDNPYSSPLNVGNVNYISGCPLFAKCDPRFQYDASARLKMIHRKATTGKKVFRKLQQTISCLANSFSSLVTIPGAVVELQRKLLTVATYIGDA